MQPFSVDSSATGPRHGYQPLNQSGRSRSLFLSSLASRIPQLLRPRLTWRYVGGSLIIAYVAYCFVFNLPFFAHKLPRYTGKYDVGTIDVEAPLQKARVVHNAKFKASVNGGGNAFELQTVLFTVYYPANKNEKSSKSKHYWIPKPIAVTAEGYARLAHVSNVITNTLFTSAVGLLVGGITIPAKVDVPLVAVGNFVTPVQLDADFADENEEATTTPESNASSDDKSLPVIVFTHGMASSRTDYTQWAGELASRGYIVAAIEHRDGSCPGTVVMKKDETTSISRNRVYFSMNDLEWDIDEVGFKEAQLSYRQAEIEETVRTLQDINHGQGKQVFDSNPREEGRGFESWEGRLNTDAMILAGHSYGATGALRALKDGPTSINLPFKGAVILDPGKSSGPLNDELSVPVLIVHSNSWSAKHSVFYGRPHFDVVRDLVEKNNNNGHPSWFMTSLGTSHPSVTDAPLLEPLLLSWTTGAKIDVHEGLRQYVHVTEDFLWFLGTGEKKNLLKEDADYPEYDEMYGWSKYKGQGHGWRKYWQVHVAPAHTSASTLTGGAS